MGVQGEADTRGSGESPSSLRAETSCEFSTSFFVFRWPNRKNYIFNYPLNTIHIVKGNVTRILYILRLKLVKIRFLQIFMNLNLFWEYLYMFCVFSEYLFNQVMRVIEQQTSLFVIIVNTK